MIRALALALLLVGAASAEKLNVLVIVSDDQRADTIAALGNPHIRTPHLDSLVRDGLAFTRAYCMGAMQGAVCVPSRAMFLSGRSLFRAPERLTEPVALWPKVMEQAGYDTFGTGKWHNGAPSFARAFSAGGPIFFGGMSNQFKIQVQDFDPSGKYPKEAVRTVERYTTELFTDSAERFLRERKSDKPFFCYVSYTVPHDPRTPPGEYASMYDPEKIPLPPNYAPRHPFDNGDMELRDEKLLPWPRTEQAVRKELAAYYGAITQMDAQIGRLLKALDETGKRSNTLIVFWSDHGLAIGSHGLLGKQNLYDHSMRAPLVFSGPGVPKGATTPGLCYLFDIFPTVCDLTGVPIPEGVEGRKLQSGAGRDAIFTAYRDVMRAVRNDRWKLIRYPKSDRTQLFDLESDPHELRDLSADPAHAGRLKEMLALLEDEKKRWGDKP
jgi:arylsulfatase A-like enzyme